MRDDSGLRARALLLCATLFAYANSLSGPFQFDDRGVIVNYQPIHSWAGYWSTAAWGLRPLLKLSYALSFSFGGSPLAFHVFNLLVHLLNVELLLRLFSAASGPERRWPFKESSPGLLFAGLLFALHPIQTEAVTYISGRSVSLATAFCLASLLLHVEGQRSGRLGLRLLSLLGFVAALGTKETAATLLLALVLWDVVIEQVRLGALLRRQAPFWLLGALLLVVAILHESYFALLYQALGARPLLESLRYQLGGLAYLFERLLLLEAPCIDPGLWLAPPSAPRVAVSAAVVLGATVLCSWLARRRPLLAFGVGWFLIQSFLPYVLVSRVDVINERHAYLANVGLFMALGSLWGELVRRLPATWLRFSPLLLAAALAWLSLRRNRDYQSELALWRSTTRVAPRNPRAQNNLGVAYELAGRHAEARVAYARALVLEPRYGAARKNLERLTPRPR